MAKIFEQNAYTKEIETKIKEIDPENKTIELEDAIFLGKVVANQVMRGK